MIDTKDRILDAAEALFARQGVAATSLRSVTAEAGVNGAAIHYHFGSKTALVQALIERRVAPINDERLARLAELEAAAGAAPVAVEALLRAFLSPMVRRGSEGGRPGEPRLAGLFAWLHGDDDSHAAAIRARFDAVKRRFAKALARATGGSDAALAGEWLDAAMGAALPLLAAVRAQRARDVDDRFERLVAFLVGAVEAASARERRRRAPARGRASVAARRAARGAGVRA